MTFFDNRATMLNKVSIKEIQTAVDKVLQSKRMLELRVGRITQRSVTKAKNNNVEATAAVE